MSPLALSVLLALVSAVAYAVGAVLQEGVAAAGRTGSQYLPVRQPAWWAAAGLNGVGALLHVGALAWGPLSLVQPLGALTIVFALPIAAVFVRRRAGAMAWRGALMATVGLAGLLSLTETAHAQALAGGEQLVVAGSAAGAMAVLFAGARGAGRRVLRSVLLAGAAGVSFGIASVFIKSLAVGWSSGGPAGHWQTVPTVAAFAATGLLLSQAAYRGAGLTAPLATVTVTNPVVASAVGLTLFDESFRYGTTGVLLACGSALVAGTGLALLTAGHARQDAGEESTAGLLPGVPAQASGVPAQVPGMPPQEPGVPGQVSGLPGQVDRAAGPVRCPPGSDQTVTPPALK
ncbi:DMT family transporter [Streptomyces sp. NPDC051561]|uniref:DMT family transporter n=1 Tax=Streptomyces sp. NPDC051561 TaxID=3365658 RepID=UPI0037ABDD73